MTKYKIVCGITDGELTKAVEKMIADRFEPIGGVTFANKQLRQAMIKNESTQHSTPPPVSSFKKSKLR
jgi:hypothetical protein